MTTPAPLHWSDALLLGHAPMDRCHEEFVAVVTALQQADDDDLPARLAAVTAHLEDHFGQEDAWMADSAFPARECHVDEHAAVMASVRQVQALLAGGDTAVCRRLADELARWFPGHADYMDAALAHWLCRQRLGGPPVVLRRHLAAAGGPDQASAGPPADAPPSSMPR